MADGITVGDGYQLVAVQAMNAVQVSTKTLPFVRKAVADPKFPMTAIMRVYTVNVIQPANTFTGIVGNEASNTDLRRGAIALGALLQVQDFESIQRAIMLRAVSFPQPTLSPDDLSTLQQAHQQETVDLANFKASVDLAEELNYTDTVTGPPVDQAANTGITRVGVASRRLLGAPAHPGECAHPGPGKREPRHVVHHRQGAGRSPTN